MSAQENKLGPWTVRMTRLGFRATLEYASIWAQMPGTPAGWAAMVYGDARWAGTKFSAFGSSQTEAVRAVSKIIESFVEENTVK